MSLIIIHGEDQVKTRQLLTARLNTNTVKIDGKTTVLEDVMQACESTSMFAEDKQVIIEDLHKKRSKTDLKTIADYLGSVDSPFQIILWESKELTATELKKFPQAEIIIAKVSPIIFKFTDSLSPLVPFKTSHDLLQQSCREESPEMVLIMIARQVKLLLQTFDSNNKLAPWQKGKLSSIATKIGDKKLISLYNLLGDIDYKNKTGQLPSDLTSELSMWLTKLYV